MTYKFEILNDCILVITNTDTGEIVLDKPKRLVYYNEKYLTNENRIVLHDTQLPHRNIIDENIRIEFAVDSTDTPFTVNSFQTFARENLGIECGGAEWGGIAGDIATQSDLTLQNVSDIGNTTTNDISIGSPDTPTAKLSVIGTSPGQDLFDVTDDAGNEIVRTNSNGTTFLKSYTSSAALLAENTLGFGQVIQIWRAGGVEIARLDGSGVFDMKGGFGAIRGQRLQFNQIGSPFFPNISLGVSAGAPNIYFTSGNNIGFSKNSIQQVLINEFGLGIGRKQTGTTGGGDPIFSFASATANTAFVVESDDKGARPRPRMTEAQRLAIASPEIGDEVYQTDGTEGVYVNKSTGWALAY